MGSAALLLALGAATLHALWNLLLRGTRDTEATTAVAVVTFVVVLVPFAAATWDVDAAAWKYVVPSGALELVYVALLAAAYRHFELSLVYPIARGLAPVATLVFAIALVSARRGAALGVAIASVIGGYTLIDRYGIRHADAFSYALLIMLGPAAAYPPFVGLRRVRAAVSPTSVAVGVLSAAAYLLVLLALRRASAPAVSAVRETGVVIAAVLAAVFLREHVGPVRFAGAVLVAGGIALLAL